ncbi:TM2 domain-containing protein [uncultured Limimaricola sp.]|uniref:TM2 domain-containing protein n=1 Tax=uncultured Limimaricola sp. TaxID=2211667 RepID=UPI0030F7F539
MSEHQKQTLPEEVPQQHKNLSTAMLLALFLGPLGAHRFYMGRTGSGAMMLMLAVTIVGLAVTALWLLIDLPRLPKMIRCHNAAIDRRRSLDRRSETHGFPLLS